MNEQMRLHSILRLHGLRKTDARPFIWLGLSILVTVELYINATKNRHVITCAQENGFND
ncbi:hypothetical protein WN943_019979 [Citrus x changshan-huyou]